MTRLAKVRTGELKVTRRPKRKTWKVLQSKKASENCCREKEVLSPPSCWEKSLWEAILRSEGVRNQAVSGPEGMAQKKRIPAKMVMAPQTRNMIRQGARLRWLRCSPIPYIIKEPTIWASPLHVT